MRFMHFWLFCTTCHIYLHVYIYSPATVLSVTTREELTKKDEKTQSSKETKRQEITSENTRKLTKNFPDRIQGILTA